MVKVPLRPSFGPGRVLGEIEYEACLVTVIAITV